ncbi:hypothetical protein SERN_0674 [Serinibacter arcticus]|uniref:HNH nuclease domain-containing protein n=1 Tax=Serinibacter arcticus TaxID=1655435 RepID=A0A4Z1E708_9MICO|nr:hypothetical protein SERN_0674 [Serinibacter arcticus]
MGAEFAPDAPVDSRQHAALERLSDLVCQEGEGLSDGEVLEVVAAWSRQVAAAELQVREWAAVLARRPSMSPMWRSASGARCETAADEVGLRLGVSRRRGQQLIDEGQVLGDVLWPVAQELGVGRIDAGKASILVEALGEQEPHVAVAVCEQVLPVAGSLDHAGLRRRVQAVIVQADPDGAMTRHQRAVRLRRVNRVRMRPDGMASFSAVLAAPDAVALEQACEAAARAARATSATSKGHTGAGAGADAGDVGAGRTLEQLRADALVSMGVRALSEGCLPLLPPADARGRRGEAVPVVLSGRSTGLTVIATAAVQRGRAGTATLADAASHDLYDWEPDPEDARDLGAADRGASTTGAARQALDPGPDPYVDWVGPPTFRPGIDAPELVGYGAIAPGVVRALVGAASWVKVVEPVFRDADPPPPTSSYRPSAELDRHVRVRDVTCVVPGCLVPAALCDLDHHVPWPLGSTSAANLHALCRRHHLMKTHAGHDLTVLPGGTIRWRTALGQIVWRSSDGTLGRGDSTDPAKPRPAPWGRTRAVPRPSDAEVDRRVRELEDAEADDPRVDDLWAHAATAGCPPAV